MIVVLLAGSPVFAGQIRVEGGGVAISAVFEPFKEPFEEATGDKLITTMTSPVKGLIALEQGLVDVATAAVPLEDMLKGAEKQGVRINPATLRTTVVGQNRTLVYTHKSNPVKFLSKQQLKDIFTGRVTNWSEVGGDNRPIVVVWGKNTPGQNAQFALNILDSEAVTSKSLAATDYANIRETIIKQPGAIGIDPHGFNMAALRNPQTPPLTSPIIAVTKGEPTPGIQKMLDFMITTTSDLGNKR
jgi:phosphate transport system substrate-binding protein